jgi:hypothetical protein
MKPAKIAFQEVLSVVLLIALFAGVTALLPADLTLARRLPDQEKLEGFSGLPFVAPSAADPQMLALYWIEGNNPVELLPLTGVTTNDKVDVAFPMADGCACCRAWMVHPALVSGDQTCSAC